MCIMPPQLRRVRARARVRVRGRVRVRVRGEDVLPDLTLHFLYHYSDHM